MSAGKRVVFVNPNGIHQILGVSPERPIVATSQPFVSLGRTVPFASLVRVTPRMVLYKEPMLPGARPSFHEAQR